MQKFTSNNPLKYQSGRLTDVALADGTSATTASDFYKLSTFEVQNAPEPVAIEDADGSRTTNSRQIIGEREYTFSFGGAIEVDRLGTWLNYAGFETSIASLGSGAYESTFTVLNNIVLPPFTLFYAIDGEDDSSSDNRAGYKRLTGCHISELSFSINDGEATFSGSGFALNEDSEVNLDSTVAVPSTATSTSFVYQSSGLIRVTMATVNLSSVSNGDVLVIPDVAENLANASNRGSFIIVNVNDASDYVEIINPNRTDNTDDESSKTVADGSIKVVTAPSYPDETAILLRNHTCITDATNAAGLDAATSYGAREFSVSINNNSRQIREACKSRSPLAILAGNVSIEMTFTQIVGTTNGAKAMTWREDNGTIRAFRIEAEDTATTLGASAENPRLQIELPEGLGIATRANMHTNEEIMYNWTVYPQNESDFVIRLKNEKSAYPS